MFSIYTSLYNLNNGFIDWKAAIENFMNFADEVVVATTDSDINQLHEYIQTSCPEKYKIKIALCDDSILDSMDFDGKLKNAALKQCTKEFCILLDGDERVSVEDRKYWVQRANGIKHTIWDSVYIPVIDLFNSEREYKSIGHKWYLHKNLPELNRGVVNFARKDGHHININKSDTCELIYDDGSLCKTLTLGYPTLDFVKNIGAKVWHLGWLDKDKRLKSNAFWQPVWNKRAGEQVTNIIHSKEKLEKIEYFPHGLKLWYE